MRPASIADIIPRRDSIPELSALLDRIEAVYKPRGVVLFGSRARGTAHADSDWDIVVVIDDEADEKLLDPMLGWTTQAGSGVRADVLCAYESEFIADLAVANSRTREIAGHAVLLASS